MHTHKPPGGILFSLRRYFPAPLLPGQAEKGKRAGGQQLVLLVFDLHVHKTGGPAPVDHAGFRPDGAAALVADEMDVGALGLGLQNRTLAS